MEYSSPAVEPCLWYGAVATALDLYLVVVFCLYFMYLRYIYSLYLVPVYFAVSVIRHLA